MIENDVLVIDATVHAFNFHPDNYRIPFMAEVVKGLHQMGSNLIEPFGDRRYRLTLEEFQGTFSMQPQLIERALFAESPVDVAVYHGVPMYGLFGDGSSPTWVASAVAERFPHRMRVYGDVSPWMEDPKGRIDQFAASGAIGLKFYPIDMVEGRMTPVDFRDDAVMSLVEHARARGIRVIAVHKAVPLGHATPRPLYHVDDMAGVVAAFPDMTFEIVHGGFAFADETADLLVRFPNVVVNLESNPCFTVNASDLFAAMMEPLLRTGAWDRLFYGTGATGMHPRPPVEGFWRYKAPAGFTPITEEMKVAILGLNFARLHGWDVEALKAACRADAYGLEGKTLRPPWEMIHERRSAA